MSNTGRKSRRRPQRKINQNMKEKLLILFGIVLLLLVILVLRITYINATSGSKYKKQVLSQAQQKYESQVLPAKRGDIYDKNGNILATSNKVYNVILDCKTVNSDEDCKCKKIIYRTVYCTSHFNKCFYRHSKSLSVCRK